MSLLLENFDLVARAPGGIEQLRKQILELAVRGKLVPQDKGDEPASVLLEKIKAEKARLVKEGKIKAPKELPEITEEEKPYELPAGWEWVRVETLGEVKLGRQRSPENHRGPHMVPYLRVANVFENRIDINDLNEMNFTPEEQRTFGLMKGDLLLNEGQSYELVGRPAIYNNELPGACFQNTLIRVRPYCIKINEYMLIAFRSYMRSGRFRKEAQQTTNIAHLSASRLSLIEIPLPPLAEQSRIVARVQELMSFLDRLEARSKEAESGRSRALVAVTRGLSESTTAAESVANWRRISSSFDSLVCRAEDVKALRSTVLELAVRGKLVPQEKRDEPASVLLEKIKAEKARLVKEGKIKAPKELPEISEEEKPYELPAGWEWVRLGDFGVLYSGGTPASGTPAYWAPAEVCWVCPRDMKKPRIDSTIDQISKKAVIDCGLDVLPPESLLIVVRGMILAKRVPIAISGINLTINQDMKCMTPFALDSVPYLRLCLEGRNDALLALVERSSHGTCKLETPRLMHFGIPLPPLAEQSRIVVRVQELMSVLDRLEAKLADKEEAAKKFAEAVVAI